MSDNLNRVLLAGVAFASILPFGPLGKAAAETQPPAASPLAPKKDLNGENPAGEIIITALRRETRLQTTPADVSAVTGDQLAKHGVNNVQDLSLLVPDLQFGDTGGQAHIAIRGIGSDVANTGNDPRVAFYEDGVYIARMSAQLSGLFDIDRVEILKGPQGTLYGRNAMGGALNVITRSPTTQANGYVNLTYGNYNEVLVDAAAGGGIAKGVAGRLAIHEEHHDGYGRNRVNGQDIDNKQELAGRASLLITPAPSLKLLTTADYSHEDDNSGGVHYIGQGNPHVPLKGLSLGGYAVANQRDIASNIQPRTNNKIWGVNETATFDVGWSLVKSITAYRDTKTELLQNVEGTNLALVYLNPKEHAKQFSEELQLSGQTGRLEWLAGALYFHETARDATTAPFSAALFGGPLIYLQGYFTGGLLKTKAFSAYAGLTYHVNDKITLSGGGRYSVETKSIADVSQLDFTRPYSPTNPIKELPGFPRSTHATFRGFIPSATASYKANKNIFAYVTYSQGFKSGGYNIGVNQPPFLPEKLRNYEAGLKTTWLNHLVTANVTAFHEKYTNLQVTQIQGTAILIQNAASATINGGDVEFHAGPFSGFSFDTAATYLDAKFNKFTSIDSLNVAAGPQNLAGKQLPQAPKLSLTAGAQWNTKVRGGQVTVRGDIKHVSNTFFRAFNDRVASQPAYELVSASIRYEALTGWSVEAFARNIGNVKTLGQSYPSNPLVGLPILGIFNPPRTYGVSLGYRF